MIGLRSTLKNVMDGQRMKNIARKNANRGLIKSSTNVVDKTRQLPSTIVQYRHADDWDLAGIKSVLSVATLSRSDAIARLQAYIPGLSRRAMETFPTNIVPPLGLHIKPLVTGYTPSINQLHQVDDSPAGDGAPLGHTMASSAIIPAWAQCIKGSGPLLDVGLALAAISIKATPGIDAGIKRGILDGFGLVFEAGQKVRGAFFRARFGHKMDPSLAPVSRAINALVTAKDSLDEDAEALHQYIETTPSTQPDLQALIDQYDGKPNHHLNDLLGKIDEDKAKLRKKRLNAAAAAMTKMTSAEFAPLVSCVEAFADRVAERLGVETQRNNDGSRFPLSLVDDPTSSPHKVLELAFVAALRGLSACDLWIIVQCNIIVLWGATTSS